MASQRKARRIPDTLVIAPPANSQRIKDAVAKLTAKPAMEATAFTGHHRPWCWVESLAICNWFKVRGIVVRPGVAGSRQAHHHPSEHWIVGAGTARVTIDDDVWLVTENNRSMLLGAAYRIKYRGKVPTVLIVVQTGSYLGVDETIS